MRCPPPRLTRGGPSICPPRRAKSGARQGARLAAGVLAHAQSEAGQAAAQEAGHGEGAPRGARHQAVLRDDACQQSRRRHVERRVPHLPRNTRTLPDMTQKMGCQWRYKTPDNGWAQFGVSAQQHAQPRTPAPGEGGPDPLDSWPCARRQAHTPMPSAATRCPLKWVSSAASRCSMWMAPPSGVSISIVVTGAATKNGILRPTTAHAPGRARTDETVSIRNSASGG